MKELKILLPAHIIDVSHYYDVKAFRRAWMTFAILLMADLPWEYFQGVQDKSPAVITAVTPPGRCCPSAAPTHSSRLSSG